MTYKIKRNLHNDFSVIVENKLHLLLTSVSYR